MGPAPHESSSIKPPRYTNDNLTLSKNSAIEKDIMISGAPTTEEIAQLNDEKTKRLKLQKLYGEQTAKNEHLKDELESL